MTEQFQSLEETLKARARTHGSFEDNAEVSQSMKIIMRSSDNWERMTHEQRESLEMIAHKMARIINGDMNHIDSWHDIAGYATLVENRLREK